MDGWSLATISSVRSILRLELATFWGVWDAVASGVTIRYAILERFRSLVRISPSLADPKTRTE